MFQVIGVQKPNETILGMATDAVAKTGKTYWVYTDQALYELGAKNEDRDVWKTYLDKQQHDLALKYARVSLACFSRCNANFDKI